MMVQIKKYDFGGMLLGTFNETFVGASLKIGVGFVRPGEILMMLNPLTICKMELFRAANKHGEGQNNHTST